MGRALFPGTSHGRPPRAPSRHPSSGVSPHRSAVQSPAFGRIDIAQRACVSKVELDDIVVVVQWWAGMATGTNPHGRARVQRSTGGDTGSGHSSARGRATVAIIGVGKGKVAKVILPLKDGGDRPG